MSNSNGAAGCINTSTYRPVMRNDYIGFAGIGAVTGGEPGDTQPLAGFLVTVQKFLGIGGQTQDHINPTTSVDFPDNGQIEEAIKS